MPSGNWAIRIPAFRSGRDRGRRRSCSVRRPLVADHFRTVEVRRHRLVVDYLDRHENRERFGVAELRRDVAFVTIPQLGVRKGTHGADDTSAMDAVAYGQGAA